jgi:hypothetical protein
VSKHLVEVLNYRPAGPARYVSYQELAKRLKKHGLEETEASVANKLSRGTFAATFFLATLAALEAEGIRLEDI